MESSGYLREIEVRFKKTKVKKDAPVGEPVTDPKQLYELFKDLQNETKEKVIAVSLDVKQKIICFEVVAIGNVQAVYVRPADVLRTPILVNAVGFVVLHNHPSGDPTPSEEDKKLTKDLKIHTDAIGIAFCDHVIIGENRYFSFSSEGLLD